MISLLVVNYQSASLAADAIRSAREATTRDIEVVVVDNSCDAGQLEQLAPHADLVIAAERNLGYAAGINRGRPSCRGEILIVANPDVVFAAGAIDEMVDAMKERKAAVAGPALFWDDALTWRLPPADLVTGGEKLDEAIASRSRAWFEWRDRRRFRARLKHWSLTETSEVNVISGAVMAIRGWVFDYVGGFDERFTLYFEENDFLRRVAGAGQKIIYVPSAACRHLFNQSSGSDPGRAASTFLESERRYLAKWNGKGMARLLKSLERPVTPAVPQPLAGSISVLPGETVVEASPLASFATAAGHFPSSPEVSLPEDVWTTYRGERLFFRTVDRKTGRVLSSYVRQRT